MRRLLHLTRSSILNGNCLLQSILRIQTFMYISVCVCTHVHMQFFREFWWAERFQCLFFSLLWKGMTGETSDKVGGKAKAAVNPKYLNLWKLSHTFLYSEHHSYFHGKTRSGQVAFPAAVLITTSYLPMNFKRGWRIFFFRWVSLNSEIMCPK